MRVEGRVAARAVFDEHALHALAGDVRQFVLVDEGHLGVLRLRRLREDAAETAGLRQTANRGMRFISPVLRSADAGSGFCL
jgi:hypothetical protein